MSDVRANLSIGGRKYGVVWAILALVTTIAIVGLVRYTDATSEDKVRMVQNLLPLWVLVFSLPILFVTVSYFSAVSRLRHNTNLHNELKYSFSDEGIATEGPTIRSNRLGRDYIGSRKPATLFCYFMTRAVLRFFPRDSSAPKG